jgi:hypothetical protein
MKKNEKIYLLITVPIVVILFGYGIWRTWKIHEEPVYVLAKIKKIIEADDMIYEFTYHFNGKEFNEGIKGYVERRDSLFFLRISKTNPKLFEQVHVIVQDCFLNPDSLNKSWEKVPACK